MPIYEAECVSCGWQYEWLDYASEKTRPCPLCGSQGERLYSLFTTKIFQPFITRNIDPEGRPIEVRSQKQLSSLCNQHGLIPLDDPKAKIKHKPPPTPSEMFKKDIRPERHEEASGSASESELMGPVL